MEYIALKKCRLSGKDYYPGDHIDGESIYGIKLQEQRGNVISVERAGQMPQINVDGGKTITLTLTHGDITHDYELKTDSVALAIKILQANANDAVRMIQESSDNDVKCVLYALDTRKTIFAALEKKDIADEVAEETSDNNAENIESDNDTDTGGEDE